MHTSTAIAEELGESAVMVRRTFLLLQKSDLIMQRKGPSGGARLKLPQSRSAWATSTLRPRATGSRSARALIAVDA